MKDFWNEEYQNSKGGNQPGVCCFANLLKLAIQTSSPLGLSSVLIQPQAAFDLSD